MCALALSQSAAKQLPRLEDARELFASHLPCPPEQLRRVYLRLALLYHPDKCSPEDLINWATGLEVGFMGSFARARSSGKPPSSSRPLPLHTKSYFSQNLGNCAVSRVGWLPQQSPSLISAELFAVSFPSHHQVTPALRTRSGNPRLGELQELRRLLEEDAGRATELDDLGVCPLMFACAGGCLEAVRLLAEFQADVQAKNPINWSVLLYASLGNHAHVVNWLVEQGVEVTAHELVLAAYTGNAVSLAALLDRYKRSVPDLRTESGKSLLHLACEGMCFLKRSAEDHARCVDLVLQQRIPIDQAEPKQGRSCLQNYAPWLKKKACRFVFMRLATARSSRSR